MHDEFWPRGVPSGPWLLQLPRCPALCVQTPACAGGGSSGGPPISREMQAEIGRFQDLQAGIRVAVYERVSWWLCSGARFRPVNGGVVNCGKTVWVGGVCWPLPPHPPPPPSTPTPGCAARGVFSMPLNCGASHWLWTERAGVAVACAQGGWRGVLSTPALPQPCPRVSQSCKPSWRGRRCWCPNAVKTRW
jgi:hypothetical protein